MAFIDYHTGSEEWVHAQEAELKFWLGKLKSIPRLGSLNEAFRVYAHDKMKKIMSIHTPPAPFDIDGSRCLEVGCGPIPFLIAWTAAKKRIAIDPLFPMFAPFNRFKIGEKNLGVWCYPIKAENFKYWKNDKFDYIICSNVLDHCDDPARLVSVLLDNLDLDGAIYLDVFLRAPGLRDEHPRGWETLDGFAEFMDPLLGEHYATQYIRIVKDEQQDRLYLKLVCK